MLLMLLLMGCCGADRADAQAAVVINPDLMREKHFLLRFIGELDAARHLLSQARNAAGVPAAQRIRFDYDRLADDLHLVVGGIEDYLHKAGAGNPRAFQPLHGDYQELKNHE